MRKGPVTAAAYVSPVPADSRTGSPQSVGNPDHHGVAYRFCRLHRGIRVGHSDTAGRKRAYFVEPPHKAFPVLGVFDGLNRGAQRLYPVFVEGPVPFQRHPAVQRCLSAEGEEYPVGPFLLNNLPDILRGDGQEIGGVRHALAGLYGCDIGVDQGRGYALLPQRLERLGAGVVKFPGLPDFKAPGAQHQHLLQIVFD